MIDIDDMDNMVVVDGSAGEGGGQVIRTSVALSALTGRPVKITNIRANRCMSGLRAQHVSGINAVADLCNAQTECVSVGSEEIEFVPNKIETKHIDVKIATAGSIGLVLQALLIPAMHIKEKIEINISGGAVFGKWSPPLLYTKHVLFPILLKMGYRIDMDILKYGYYPKGGSEVKVVVQPAKELKTLDLSDRGRLLRISGAAHSSSSLKKGKVSEREAEAAEKYLSDKYGVPVNVDVKYSGTDSVGTSIVLWAEFENTVMGADALGDVGVRAETVGHSAAKILSGFIDSGATVDEYMGDQLPPYLASVKGMSSYTMPEMSSHAKTNIDVVKMFLDKDFVLGKEKRCTIITVK
ncbi:MAG: RNA 3'-terminal phosphate cyclase [Nanohaloarchaea archaeon]|nr:RNA 3'-terminal phosphate cyclase [Candidatus Nanohaloarchaea archaeon]